jgi:hypothetical protein
MPLTIRAATSHDHAALTRLAATGSRGHTLLAERGGVAVAAVALTTGAVAAAANAGAEDAVRLLRLRRYQLLRQGGEVGPAASLLRRLAPRPA